MVAALSIVFSWKFWFFVIPQQTAQTNMGCVLGLFHMLKKHWLGQVFVSWHKRNAKLTCYLRAPAGSGVDSQGDVSYVSYWWLCLLLQNISAVCCLSGER